MNTPTGNNPETTESTDGPATESRDAEGHGLSGLMKPIDAGDDSEGHKFIIKPIVDGAPGAR